MKVQRAATPFLLLAFGILPLAGCTEGNVSDEPVAAAEQDRDYGEYTAEEREQLKDWVRPEVFDRRTSSPPRVSDKFPNYVMTTQHGKKVRFYDDMIKDRTVIVYFMYTKCDGI